MEHIAMSSDISDVRSTFMANDASLMQSGSLTVVLIPSFD